MSENASNENERGEGRWREAASTSVALPKRSVRRRRFALAGREVWSREPREASGEQRRASVAISNLRGVAIVFLVMMHSSLAYLASSPAQPAPFDQPPYMWIAFPVLDRSRWIGLDLFCAWQDVYLMCLMFFIAGLFTLSSLERDGALRFLLRRSLRLGSPILLAVLALMPLALYPAYLFTTPEPRFGDYLNKYRALPFEPSGPLWFAGALLALTIIAVVISRFRRSLIVLCSRMSLEFDVRPARAFSIWALVSIVAYTPLALIYTPWSWENWGPFGIQLSRIALYAAYFGAGVGVGAAGLGVGLLRPDGAVARRWRSWAGAAFASFALWIGLTGLVLHLGDAAPFPIALASNASFALAGGCSLVFLLALSLRFSSHRRSHLLAQLSDDSFGVYVLHYAPLVWLQYALLDVSMPAVLKALFVTAGSIVASMAVLFACRLALAGLGARRVSAAI